MNNGEQQTFDLFAFPKQGALMTLERIERSIIFHVGKPPMLRGASRVATVVLPIFEFIFYWCICFSLASVMGRVWGWLRGSMKARP